MQALRYDSTGNVIGAVIRGTNDTIEYDAKLLVGADGGQSPIRQELRIPAQQTIYNHELIVVHMLRPRWFRGDLRTRVYLHKSGAVILLPLPNDRMRVAVVVSPKQATEWKRLNDAELSNRIAARLPLLKGIPVFREGEHIYRMVRMHAESYSTKGAVLIGDAAHLTHASSGQGMNMAIQDADVLSVSVKQFLDGEISQEEALKKYEQLRRPINEATIERSNFMASVVFTPQFSKHSLKVAGLYSLRFVPGMRTRLGTRIAQGISGVNPVQVNAIQS
jgi:2-polyprenyl-6-methoxyphenol hydroxylase-like FAD-dependent oxidoreductase